MISILQNNLFRFHSFLTCFIVLLSLKSIAQSDTIQTTVPHLKNVYKNDFYIGCLLSYAHIGFATDPYVPGQSNVVNANGGYLIKFHMNSMSPGNWMKPAYIVDISGSASAYNQATTQQEKDSIDIHPIINFNGNIIAQLNWAKRQGFTFRGHTLVWHNQTPGTAFFRSGYADNGIRLSKEKMTERMGNYIKEVIRILHENWPGLLSAYDVVNEAIDDNTGAVRTTNNEWYITFGDSTYIMKAFEFMRTYTSLYGETQIKLYYNDYNTHVSKKADGIVRLLTPIYQAGLLDGIGMQEHDNNSTPTASQWISTYNKFEPICSEMAVTEFDVATGSATPSSSVLNTQANQYGQLFKCFVERSYFSGRGKIINVSKDGLNDQWTFQTNQASSLWNAQNQCKPAFYAVVKVGNNYNELDSIIASVDTLIESNYTSESWNEFSSALNSAYNIIAQNYSNSISAADALENAKNDLSASIQNLISITDVENLTENIPVRFELKQNYPNPFNPSTQISYTVPDRSYITLKVYNVLGKEVATIFEGYQQKGSYSAEFNGTGFSSGTYFYQLRSNDVSITKKFILLK